MKAAPPALPDEVVEEILLRLPPNDPASILRASVVCKAWGRAVSDPSFRRRLHEVHGTPPVLGFLRMWDGKAEHTPRFIPTTASPFSLDAPPRRWRALDCRHGRALFLSKGQDELLVWEPITGAERLVPVPAACESASYGSAAVCCAADACDHRDCHGDPFQLVLVFSVSVASDDYDILACVYSSETGTWGDSTSVHYHIDLDFTDFSSLLVVGSSLLYFMSDYGYLVEYDLARHTLAVFDALDMEESNRWQEPDRVNLVLAEDGRMRVSQVSHLHLKLWRREDAQWVLTWVINLANLLQIGLVGPEECTSVRVVGFAEGANLIFVDTDVGVFTLELQSEKVTKVCYCGGFSNLIPVVGFYTPVPRGEPSEEACGEEDKAVEQTTELFHKQSNSTREGDFVNAYEWVGRGLKIRVPLYEEFSLEGASRLNRYGCALLTKDQEVINPSGDVSKSAQNEESVKGTSSKGDARNSTTSDSNDECAPPLEKDLYERIFTTR